MAMEVKIEKQKENKLLQRKEITVLVSFTGPTPKRDEIKNAVCSKLGIALDAIVLREIKPKFGVKQLKVVAHAYKDVDTMKKTEPRHVLARYGLAEKKPKKEKKKKTARKKGGGKK